MTTDTTQAPAPATTTSQTPTAPAGSTGFPPTENMNQEAAKEALRAIETDRGLAKRILDGDVAARTYHQAVVARTLQPAAIDGTGGEKPPIDGETSTQRQWRTWLDSQLSAGAITADQHRSALVEELQYSVEQADQHAAQETYTRTESSYRPAAAEDYDLASPDLERALWPSTDPKSAEHRQSTRDFLAFIGAPKATGEELTRVAAQVTSRVKDMTPVQRMAWEAGEAATLKQLFSADDIALATGFLATLEKEIPGIGAALSQNGLTKSSAWFGRFINHSRMIERIEAERAARKAKR